MVLSPAVGLKGTRVFTMFFPLPFQAFRFSAATIQDWLRFTSCLSFGTLTLVDGTFPAVTPEAASGPSELSILVVLSCIFPRIWLACVVLSHDHPSLQLFVFVTAAHCTSPSDTICTHGSASGQISCWDADDHAVFPFHEDVWLHVRIASHSPRIRCMFSAHDNSFHQRFTSSRPSF